jgi:hypothetical protein
MARRIAVCLLNRQGFGAILLCDASEGSVPHGTLPYREKRLPHQPKDRG